MGAHRLDAVGADAYRGGELEYRTGVGSGGHLQSDRHVIPIFALRYPMALFGYTETRVPYLYVSAPLIALGYLIWQRSWSHR